MCGYTLFWWSPLDILLTTVYVSNFETTCQLTPIRVLVEYKLTVWLGLGLVE